MPLAKVTFHDSEGKILAEGISDDRYHYIHLIHPDVGDCYELENAATTSRAGRRAWQECFAVLSTWTPKWVQQVKSATVTYQNATYRDIPLKVSMYNSDWPLWWVPLPHIGGKPYSYYSAPIAIEDAN